MLMKEERAIIENCKPCINMDSYEVMIDDEEVSLTKKETEYFGFLINSGKVFSRRIFLTSSGVTITET